MRIHLYDSYRSQTCDRTQSSAIVADFVAAFAAWLRAQGHEVADIPKLAGAIAWSDVQYYFHDVDMFFAYVDMIDSGRTRSRQAPLHEMLSNAPTHLTNFFPVALATRPSAIERILAALHSAHTTNWIWFDPDFERHYRLLTGGPPKGRRLDVLMALPGVAPAPSLTGADAVPRVFLFANLKTDRLEPTRYDAALLARCVVATAADPMPDCLDVVATQAGIEPAAVLRDATLRELLRDLVLSISAAHRRKLIDAVARLPSRIHTDAAPDVPGLAQAHRDCRIAAPLPYRETFDTLGMGDIVVCPPVWAMRNALTERCATSMLRGAVPILPGRGTHVEILARAGIDGIYYNAERPESVGETIMSLLEDRNRLRELAARARRFALQHCAPEGVFAAMLDEMNARLLESLH